MGRTGNDDLVPSVTLDNAGDRLELTFDDGHGLVGFALFEGFTDAGNDGETGVDGGLGLIKRFFWRCQRIVGRSVSGLETHLVSDQLVGIAKQTPPL